MECLIYFDINEVMIYINSLNATNYNYRWDKPFVFALIKLLML